jgi:hypothetical protein
MMYAVAGTVFLPHPQGRQSQDGAAAATAAHRYRHLQEQPVMAGKPRYITHRDERTVAREPAIAHNADSVLWAAVSTCLRVARRLFVRARYRMPRMPASAARPHGHPNSPVPPSERTADDVI